ncbi:hypothetical protein SAMN03159318_01066 [Pseudomonas sp. NFACC42-2]|jgi:hypothetical protein|nr:hypothetical protein SAMN03159318_01066 [Pseudomonas sp. NFACC42-2]
MKNYAYYAALPDFVSSRELDAEFVELLVEFESKSIVEADFI